MNSPSQPPEDSLPFLQGQVISSPGDVFKLMQAEMSGFEQEHVRVLLLDMKNRVIKGEELYIGTINYCEIRHAEVMRLAVRENAPLIIIVHNHPSGDPTPSSDDVRMTEELVSAGQILGIELVDHIIIGRTGFVSLKERRLGFKASRGRKYRGPSWCQKCEEQDTSPAPTTNLSLLGIMPWIVRFCEHAGALDLRQLVLDYLETAPEWRCLLLQKARQLANTYSPYHTMLRDLDCYGTGKKPVGEGKEEAKRLARDLGGVRMRFELKHMARFRGLPMHQDSGFETLTARRPWNQRHYPNLLPELKGNSRKQDLERKWAFHRN